jgi:hypothetical protein
MMAILSAAQYSNLIDFWLAIIDAYEASLVREAAIVVTEQTAMADAISDTTLIQQLPNFPGSFENLGQQEESHREQLIVWFEELLKSYGKELLGISEYDNLPKIFEALYNAMILDSENIATQQCLLSAADVDTGTNSSGTVSPRSTNDGSSQLVFDLLIPGTTTVDERVLAEVLTCVCIDNSVHGAEQFQLSGPPVNHAPRV